jgi:hypothetical protein
VSEEKPPQNKKTLIIMSAVGLVLMAAIAFVLTRPHASLMVTDAYLYYPENTAFYMEVAPGDKLSSRFFKGIDKLRALSERREAHSELQIGELFKKDFEPQIGIGVWAPPAGQNASPGQEPPIVVVIPVKKGVTMETITADLKLPMDAYSMTKEGDATILQSKSADHPPLALHQDHLLTASSIEVLKQALAEYKTPKTMLDNPLLKENLGLLPGTRQGTIVALSNEFQNFPKDARTQDENFKKLMEFQQQMQAATPIMVGSITVDKDQFIHMDSFTPVDLSKVQDEAFRKDIKTLFEAQANFDLPGLLPKDTIVYGGMVGLGSYYDIYLNHIANQQGKEAITNAQSQLKMMGLDLRKNIISLLDGKSGVGVVSKQGQPDVLVFLNHNPDTQKALDQFGTIAAQMTGGRIAEQKVDDKHMVKVLESPAMPLKVAYSNVQESTMVVGTQAGVEEMYNVQQKKSPSLKENPLYKELSANMPQKAGGVFFVDFNQGTSLLDDLAKKSARPTQEAQFKEVLGGIEGVAGSNTMEGEKMMKGHLTIKLSAEK